MSRVAAAPDELKALAVKLVVVVAVTIIIPELLVIVARTVGAFENLLVGKVTVVPVEMLAVPRAKLVNPATPPGVTHAGTPALTVRT
jgi:hypothetical protein